MNWTFETVRLDERGIPHPVALSDEQEERIEWYSRVLEQAAISDVAKPPFSKFFVRVAIGASGVITPFHAGNREYGVCKALHGEESAVAAFRSALGNRPVRDVVLGFRSEREGVANKIPHHCGNCRDILRDEFGPDLEDVVGSPNGGEAIVVPFSIFLFNAFERISRREFGNEVLTIYDQQQRIENDAYSPVDVFPERRYAVMIQGKYGRYFGALDVMCDYHPIFALRDAVRQARRARDPYVSHVTVIHDESLSEDAADVMYQDRQHLFELNLQGELVTGQQSDPPIFLANHRKGKVTDVWRTTVKQWLQFPFDPSRFGSTEALTNYFKTRER